MSFKIGDEVAIISWKGNEEYIEDLDVEKFKFGEVEYVWPKEDWMQSQVRVRFDENSCCTFPPNCIILKKVLNSPLYKALK